MTRVLAAAGWLLALAHASEAVCAEKVADGREAFVRRVFTITDLVLQHHIDPPTRQEMILSGLKTALAADNRPPSSDLSRRVSDVKTPQELKTLLIDVWPQWGEAPDSTVRNASRQRSTGPIAVDQRAIAKLTSAQLQTAFIEGLLKAVPGQPHILQEKEARVESQLQANRYVGIGIALGWDQKNRLPQIGQVNPDGPAAGAGIQAGDLIERVNDDLPASNVGEVVWQLRGAEGTELTLRVRQPGSKEPRTVTLVRRPVMLKTVHSSQDASAAATVRRIDSDPTHPIAYLTISAITDSTTHELRSWEARLRSAGIRALVLDLRHIYGSPFGADHAAILLADSLLGDKPIGKLCTRDGVREFKAGRDCLFRDWPLAVLISKYTSGPAEWVVAALQDADLPSEKRRRAVILGTPSGGNNLVKTALSLPDSDEALVLATARWERPNADRLSKDTVAPTGASPGEVNAHARRWRVIPDIVVQDAAPSDRSSRVVAPVAKVPRKASPERGTRQQASKSSREPNWLLQFLGLPEPMQAEVFEQADPVKIAAHELTQQLISAGAAK